MERIQDPVLGAIEFPEEGPVRDLLDLEAFQRTRHLLQLGPAHLVFPTAHHTRFSHSIGVYECCRRSIRSLHMRGNAERKRMATIVEVAALLHDIGHYPLSHTVEAAYPALIGPIVVRFKSGEILFEGEALAPNDDSWIPNPEAYGDGEGEQTLLQYSADRKKPGPGTHHEKIGALVVKSDRWGVRQTLENHDIDPNAVADAINGQCTTPRWGRLMSTLIHSEFDADRLDYLLRDASTIGSTYGTVEANHLLNKMRRVFDGKIHNIVFDENVVPALDHFVMSRYFAYQAIIFHRAVCCFDVLTRAAYLAMVKYFPEFPKTALQVRAMAQGEAGAPSLLRYDDNLYWFRLKMLAEDPAAFDEVTSMIASWILERSQPRVVKEIRVAYTSTTQDDAANGDPQLLAYEERKANLRSLFDERCEALGIDRRLVFSHESSKGIYGSSDYDWNPADGLPESDSILIQCEGESSPRPLESVQHSLVNSVGNRAFKYFRLYAPREYATPLAEALKDA